MKDCIFCKIVRGEMASSRIYEDAHCIVILDAFPATEGQTLVISKEHVPYAFDLDEHLYSHLLLTARKIVKALDLALKPERTCLVIEGFHVPHTHIKLYPVKGSHLQLSGTQPADGALLTTLTQKIRSFL